MKTRAPLRPGTLSPWREVPAHIPRPEYVGKAGPKKFRGSDIQTPETIEKMRIAGRRYERQAVRITDPEVHAELAALGARKYGFEAPVEPDLDGLWFFRMDPRPGG